MAIPFRISLAVAIGKLIPSRLGRKRSWENTLVSPRCKPSSRDFLGYLGGRFCPYCARGYDRRYAIHWIDFWDCGRSVDLFGARGNRFEDRRIQGRRHNAGGRVGLRQQRNNSAARRLDRAPVEGRWPLRED